MTVLLKASFYMRMEEEDGTAEDCKNRLESALDDIAYEDFSGELYQLHIEASEPFEHDKYEPLYDKNCDLALLEQHFAPLPVEEPFDYPWEIKPGQWFKHFKGKHVEIIAVAQHTENPLHQMVIYEEWTSGKIWARPLGMFCSKVDREKYPDVTQEYRFEPMKKDHKSNVMDHEGKEQEWIRKKP